MDTPFPSNCLLPSGSLHSIPPYVSVRHGCETLPSVMNGSITAALMVDILQCLLLAFIKQLVVRGDYGRRIILRRFSLCILRIWKYKGTFLFQFFGTQLRISGNRFGLCDAIQAADAEYRFLAFHFMHIPRNWVSWGGSGDWFGSLCGFSPRSWLSPRCPSPLVGRIR